MQAMEIFLGQRKLPGRENSKCKGPEVGTFLACSRKSKEAMLLPILRKGGEVGLEMRLMGQLLGFCVLGSHGW